MEIGRYRVRYPEVRSIASLLVAFIVFCRFYRDKTSPLYRHLSCSPRSTPKQSTPCWRHMRSLRRAGIVLRSRGVLPQLKQCPGSSGKYGNNQTGSKRATKTAPGRLPARWYPPRNGLDVRLYHCFHEVADDPQVCQMLFTPPIFALIILAICPPFRHCTQTLAVGEKDGADAERALIASTAYNGDALRFRYLIRCSLPMPWLWRATAVTSWSKLAPRYLPPCNKTVFMARAKRAAKADLTNCNE